MAARLLSVSGPFLRPSLNSTGAIQVCVLQKGGLFYLFSRTSENRIHFEAVMQEILLQHMHMFAFKFKIVHAF